VSGERLVYDYAARHSSGSVEPIEIAARDHVHTRYPYRDPCRYSYRHPSKNVGTDAGVAT
jgi:hypothetical protein